MQGSSLFKLFIFLSICHLSLSTTFTISNYCSQTIWPGTLAGAGTPALSSTGFMLQPGQTARLQATPGWSGRMWARTGCQFDQDGTGICQTGDCGGRLECSGAGALPPATLFEITLGKNTNELDFYDVSLVDGYNLPVVVIPKVQHGTCNATGCIADLNQECPKELQVDCGEGVIACRSACEAFGQDEFCCSGQYGNPSTCQPTRYSAAFKAACPRAYSYAYDDKTSTFTCNTASDYTIAFCPPSNAMKRSDGTWVSSTPPQNSATGTVGSTPPQNSTTGTVSSTPPQNSATGTVGSTPPQNSTTATFTSTTSTSSSSSSSRGGELLDFDMTSSAASATHHNLLLFSHLHLLLVFLLVLHEINHHLDLS